MPRGKTKPHVFSFLVLHDGDLRLGVQGVTKWVQFSCAQRVSTSEAAGFASWGALWVVRCLPIAWSPLSELLPETCSSWRLREQLLNCCVLPRSATKNSPGWKTSTHFTALSMFEHFSLNTESSPRENIPQGGVSFTEGSNVAWK